MAQQHKTCTVCGETKPLDGFSKKKTGKYGVNSQCKSCRSEYDGRYRDENREKKAASSRRYYEANRDDILEQKSRYREANRDEIAEWDRRYHEANRDMKNAKRAKYIREVRELVEAFATVPPGTPYLPGEDALILADNGMTMYQKAIELGRTYEPVQARRQKLLEKLNA